MSMILSPAQASRAASAYRALIKAQRFTFKGDDVALRAAHLQTRVLFNKFLPSASSTSSLSSASTSVPSTSTMPIEATPMTSEEIDGNINSAFEIATYLRRNVVQGLRNEDGNYALRLTKETERGDNESIRAPSLKEARPLRPPTEGNEGVKRRRRAKAVPNVAAEESS